MPFSFDFVIHRASSASQYSIGAKGAMGTAEKFFLTPKDTDEYDNVPPLDMFDAEIDVYRVRNKIGYYTVLQKHWMPVSVLWYNETTR